jgi:hypothetical protein
MGGLDEGRRGVYIGSRSRREIGVVRWFAG